VRNLVEGRWNFEQTRRSLCPPWGLWGGTPGEPGDYLLRLPQEKTFTPRAGAHIQVPLDAEAIVRTGGGGGWGDPLERDPALVQTDVAEEFVSRAVARATYGVVLKGNLAVDEVATGKLRATLRARRKSGATARASRGRGKRS
jgi:N-methylhydantoinase B